MSFVFEPVPISTKRAGLFTANLAQAAGTYDLATASGDMVINLADIAVYVATAGATFTSVSIQTNQTNATTIMSSGEGAVANLTAQKNVVRAIAGCQSIVLKSGQKIQFTIAGSTGTGSLNVAIPYMPLSAGAVLS